MSIFRFFRRSAERDDAKSPPPTATKTTGATPELTKAAPQEPKAEPSKPPLSSSPQESSVHESMDGAIEMFKTIQEVMGRSEDIVRIPARVLLASLPPELRGSQWNDQEFPDATIELERQPLLDQLRKGRVMYRLNDLTVGMPAGWVQSDPDAMVELNLAELVSVLPPDLLETTAKLDDELIEVAQMRDYFAPQKAEIPVAASEPVPAIATPSGVAGGAAAEAKTEAPWRRREVPLTARDGWDGVERLPDAGPDVVDINEADISELASVPGFGQSRAQLIVEYRKRFGPFRSIYELLSIPGIGRRVFFRATGLEPGLRKRGDRHAVLCELLNLPRDERPALTRIAELVPTVLSARGCVLAGPDGFVLASSPGVEKEAARYAAVVPKLYRRARKYLKQLSPTSLNVISFPLADPPLLTVLSSLCHMVIVMGADGEGAPIAQKATRIAAEIEWLLSRRAIVRAAS